MRSRAAAEQRSSRAFDVTKTASQPHAAAPATSRENVSPTCTAREPAGTPVASRAAVKIAYASRWRRGGERGAVGSGLAAEGLGRSFGAQHACACTYAFVARLAGLLERDSGALRARLRSTGAGAKAKGRDDGDMRVVRERARVPVPASRLPPPSR
mmetsp:Transcript_5459/g.14242  ORF Transcript_5459/g.14242 Transcript_5459/m.14242 type:complete len:156 (-) Transcript_5459:619-1086(-)